MGVGHKGKSRYKGRSKPSQCSGDTSLEEAQQRRAVSGGGQEGKEEARAWWKAEDAGGSALNLALQVLLDWGAAVVTPTDLILGLHLSLTSWCYLIIMSPPDFSRSLSLAHPLAEFTSLELGQLRNGKRTQFAGWEQTSRFGSNLGGAGKGKGFLVGVQHVTAGLQHRICTFR